MDQSPAGAGVRTGTPDLALILERLNRIERLLAELAAGVRPPAPTAGGPPPLLLTRQQAAAAAGVKPRAFDLMRHRGELPGLVKGKGRPRWRRADIERAVAERPTR